MNTFTSFVVSLLYTMILYGAGPLALLRFRKKPITRKRLKAFSIAYSFSVWFFSNLYWVLYTDSDVSSGGAAILWGGIFYAYMKREFGKTGQLVEKMPAIPKGRFLEQETNMGKFVVDTETGEVVKESNTSHDFNEPIDKPVPVVLEEPSEKKHQFPLAVCILSCVCVALAACSLWLWSDAQRIHTQIETISEENSDLRVKTAALEKEIEVQNTKYQELQNEKAEVERHLDVANQYGIEMYARLSGIGFIPSGSKIFHHFECDDFKKAENFWAHNVEFCEYLGYSKCPKCWE